MRRETELRCNCWHCDRGLWHCMAAVDAPQTFFFFKLFIFFVLLSFIVREILCISQDTDHQHTAREERSSTVHRQPAGT